MSLWITLDVEIGSHPKMAELPSDAARYGWILALCEAKKQRQPGTFASAKHFRLVMGHYGRFMGVYLKAKFLEEGPDGTVLVHDWRRHQWAVAQQTRRGHGDDAALTSGGLQEDVSRAVPVDVPVSVLENAVGGVGGGADPWAVYCGLTGAVRPSPNVVAWLTRLEDRYGALPLSSALGLEWTADNDRKTLLSRTEHRLERAARMAEVAHVVGKREAKIASQAKARMLERFRFTGEWDERFGPRPEGSAA